MLLFFNFMVSNNNCSSHIYCVLYIYYINISKYILLPLLYLSGGYWGMNLNLNLKAISNLSLNLKIKSYSQLSMYT